MQKPPESRRDTSRCFQYSLCALGIDESRKVAVYWSLSFRIVVLSVLAVPAYAQSSASSDDGFCASAPSDLFVALEGDWSLAQGPGSARAGVISLPLPPQRPVTLKLEFQPDVGVGFLSGQGQQMALIPAVPGLVAEKMELLPQAETEKYENTGTDCNWYSLPSFVGTNDYVLDGNYQAAELEAQTAEFVNLPFNYVFHFCENNPVYEFLLESKTLSSGVTFSSTLTGNCNSPALPPGQMSMTIVARFDSPNSGFGHVYFEGNQPGGGRYVANAPITLSK